MNSFKAGDLVAVTSSSQKRYVGKFLQFSGSQSVCILFNSGKRTYIFIKDHSSVRAITKLDKSMLNLKTKGN